MPGYIFLLCLSLLLLKSVFEIVNEKIALGIKQNSVSIAWIKHMCCLYNGKLMPVYIKNATKGTVIV